MDGESGLGDLSNAIAMPPRFARGVLARTAADAATFEVFRREDAAAFAGKPERHYLIVTAPFGPFSRALGRELREAGARCSRVVLNGGDLYDWGFADAVFYLGSIERWSAWLEGVIRRQGVTDLILYGDSQPHCARAKRLAADLDLAVHVLEQGYFRPFWITLERSGVNGASPLQRAPAAYLEAAAETPLGKALSLQPLTPWAVYRITAYHAALYFAFLFFPNYRLPYAFPTIRQMLGM